MRLAHALMKRPNKTTDEDKKAFSESKAFVQDKQGDPTDQATLSGALGEAERKVARRACDLLEHIHVLPQGLCKVRKLDASTSSLLKNQMVHETSTGSDSCSLRSVVSGISTKTTTLTLKNAIPFKQHEHLPGRVELVEIYSTASINKLDLLFNSISKLLTVTIEGLEKKRALLELSCSNSGPGTALDTALTLAQVKKALHDLRRTETTRRIFVQSKANLRPCTRYGQDLAPMKTSSDYMCQSVYYEHHSTVADKKSYGRIYAKGRGVCTHSNNAKYVQGGHSHPSEFRQAALQGMPRELRSILASDYHDIDMVNAFGSISRCLAQQLGILQDMPRLAEYTKDKETRAHVLDVVTEHHGLTSRDDAKTLFILILHGGTYKDWLWNVRPSLNATAPEGCHELVVAFSAEMSTFRSALFKSSDQVSELIQAERPHIVSGQCGTSHLEWSPHSKTPIRVRGRRDMPTRTGAISEADRSQYAYILQTHEDRLLWIIIRAFRRKGWQAGSLQFDGLFIKPIGDGLACPLPMAIEYAEQSIRRETNNLFSIELVEKPLHLQNADTLISRMRALVFEAIRLV